MRGTRHASWDAPQLPITATRDDTDGGTLERHVSAPFQAPYAEHSKAPAIWAPYRRDWRRWTAWLAPFGVRPDDATPEHVAAWCEEDLADTHKASTVGRKVASLGAMYRFMGRRSPTRTDLVRTTLAGIRRAKGTARQQAEPLTADLLRQITADLDPDRPADCRNAALLLVGFAMAGRRSELVALDVSHVEFVHGGMTVTIAKSKTDQEGAGATIGVPTGASAQACPVAWLRRWLSIAGIESGPIFRMVDAHGNVRQGYVRDAQSLDAGNPLRATGL